MKTQIIKPARCESAIVRKPIAPCEILPAGLAGELTINGKSYAVEILGYLPPVGEPVLDGYRLTKGDGTAHDICLVAGRMECTCGDYEFRRSAQQTPDLADCKHIKAAKAHLLEPRDQHTPTVTFTGYHQGEPEYEIEPVSPVCDNGVPMFDNP